MVRLGSIVGAYLQSDVLPEGQDDRDVRPEEQEDVLKEDGVPELTAERHFYRRGTERIRKTT